MAFEKIGVEAQVKGFGPYMDKMDKMEAKTSGFGTKIASIMKTGAVAGVAAAGALGVASIKMGMDFEKSMAEVRTLMPKISDKVFGKMQKDVLSLSKEMGIATDKVVPALYQAISAGVPPKNVIEFLRTGAKASIGGVTDLETAIDGLTTITNAWGLDTKKAGKVADVMFTGVKLGKTTMNELSRSMFQAAPLASALGISVEEVVAATATLTKGGVPTAIAMTQMRQAMVALTKPTADMAELLEETGYATGEALIEAKGFTGALQVLTSAAGGNKEVMGKAFGSVEALGFVLGVTGDNAQTAAEDLTAVTDSAGASDEAFKTMSDTASFKLNKAINSFKIILTDIGLKALPLIISVIEEKVIPTFRDVISVVADFVAWLNRNKETLGLLALAITLYLIPAIAALTEHVWAHIAAMTTQATTMLAANPILLALTAGVAALGIAYLVTDKEGQKMALNFLTRIGKMEAKVLHAVLGPFGIDPLFGRIVSRVEEMGLAIAEFNEMQDKAARGSAKWAEQMLADLQAMTSEGEELGLTVRQIELAQLEKLAQELAIIGPLMKDEEIGTIWSAAMEEVMRSSGLGADEIDRLIDRAVELSGASEEGGKIIRENLTAAIEDMHLPVKGAKTDLEEMTGVVEGIPEPIDEATEAFTTFKEDVDEAMKGAGKAIQSLLPTLDEEFAAWQKRLAEMAVAYTDFEQNLGIVLDALLRAHVEQPELIIQSLAEAGPGVTQAMATHLALNPVAAVDKTLANLGIVVGTNIDAATDAVLEKTPAFEAQMGALAQGAADSAEEAMSDFGPTFGELVDKGALEIEKRLPTFKEEMARLARESVQAFIDNFATKSGLPLDGWIRNYLYDAEMAARGQLEADSPSKVFERIGQDITLGLFRGLGEMKPVQETMPKVMMSVAHETVLAPSTPLPATAVVSGGGVDPAALAAAVAFALQGMTVMMDGRVVGSLINERLGEGTFMLSRGG